MELSISTIAYNMLMAIVDYAFLVNLATKPSLVSFLFRFITCGVLAGLFSFLIVFFFGERFFGAIRLFAWGVFLHGFIILCGSTIILWKSFKKTAAVCAISTLGLGAIAVDAFFIEPTQLEISYVKLTSNKLNEKLRIAVVADIQTDVIGNYEKEVLTKALAEKPDIILLAGDYIQELDIVKYAKLFDDLRSLLKELNFSAPLGVYAVQGNVDIWEWHKIFGGLGITTIQNTKTITIKDFQLTGLSLNDSFNSQLHIKGSDKFHIVFGHAPDFALGNVNADLLVAGHTHGGQVRLPLIGPLITLSEVPRRMAAGVSDLENGRTLVVSRGIGMERGFAPRMRFLCRPELIVIEISPQN